MISGSIKFRPNAELALRVNRLSFFHNESKAPTLAEISFDVTFGERVVITGPSGAGKTTLGNLLLGMLDPTEGSVEIFGVPPADYRQMFPGKISLVPQSPKLISGSLLENIGLGLSEEEIDIAVISELLDKCALTSLVRQLPSGVRTEIGGSLRNLSGGEIQRISLARALYSRPDVLLLDEPTDGLDVITTETIRKTILDLSGVSTVLVIAHTLSAISEADRVIFLEKGRVSGDGSVKDLRDSNANFKSLIGGDNR